MPSPPFSDRVIAFTLAESMSQIDVADLREFIEHALVDPRVRDETFPFDRPTLRSERLATPRAPEEPVSAPNRTLP